MMIGSYLEKFVKGSQDKPAISDAQQSETFSEFFLNDLKFPSQNVNHQNFEYFKQIFLSQNASLQKIEVDENRIVCRKSANIVGFDKLASIFLQSDDALVVQDSMIMLIALLTKFHISICREAQKIFNDFVSDLATYIEKCINDDILTCRGLSLLLKLVEIRDPLSQNSTMYMKRESDLQYKPIEINNSGTIKDLRKEIAKIYAEPIEKIVLKVNDKLFGPSENDLKISALNSISMIVIFMEPSVMDYEARMGLSSHHQLYDCLFQLLLDNVQRSSDLAWTLLMTLPTYDKIVHDIYTLSSELMGILNPANPYKLLYCLMVLNRYCSDQSWKLKFIGVNGPEYLIKLFLYIKGNIKGKPLIRLEEALINILGKLLRFPLENHHAFIEAIMETLSLMSISPHQLNNIRGLFESLTEIINFLVLYYKSETSSEILNFIHTNDLIYNSLIAQKSSDFGFLMLKLMENIANLTNIHYSFALLMLQLLPKAKENKSKLYFDFFAFLFKKIPNKSPFLDLFNELFNEITLRWEINSGYQDIILYGSLKVLANGWTSYLLSIENSLDFFLQKCLFEIPESTRSPFPKCKNIETRQAGFELLYDLCKNSDFLSKVTNLLEKFHYDNSWRSNHKSDWNRFSLQNEKSLTGFTGIRNLGCTCYMNSLIQSLYTIPSLRDGILYIPTVASEDNVLFQLKRIFSGLKNSDKPFISTRKFCRAYKDCDGNPVNLYEQKDADEFFGNLMERLENALKGSNYENLVQSHFGGYQVLEIESKDCPHKTQRFEPFLTIPIEVKNKRMLSEGLKSLVEGEILEADNAYLCEQCHIKVKALKRVSIKCLPNYLMLALRRFEFNFETMKPSKLNEYFEFPSELDMEPYTQEGLKNLENGSGVFEKNYYNYKLRGIIIHTGDAERGHYYSFIYDFKKKSWINFNDTMVYEIPETEIAANAFGGFLKNTTTGEIKQKITNGYLLLYERIKKYRLRNPESDEIEKINLNTSYGGVDIFERLYKEKNKKYWKIKYVFGYEYAWFINEMTKLENPPVKFIIENFLAIQIRNRDRGGQFMSLVKAITRMLEQEENADWFLEKITDAKILKEILFMCPVSEVRKIIVELAEQALRYASIQIKTKTNERAALFFNTKFEKIESYFRELSCKLFSARGF
ncbi:unnamed protein product [Blepharisma stoltei]|uniref:USP domain-containing protein n=1 Tax=Blepharisma stoltei TaxID=1481888 RepID=A0AAU9K8M7_9CILI|nr:unnamed protein product [Blepharisma stoltei]